MAIIRRTTPPRASVSPRTSQRRGWTVWRLAPPCVALLAAVGAAAFYWLYLRTDDVSPDSRTGYGFAIAGTAILGAVGVGYVARKRLWRHRSGLLHTALKWHVAGGSLALLLILMHAAGNFHPRTGTYALYALVALVISGIVGKWLDRIAPRRAARSAMRTLTLDGEDRLESLAGVLRTHRGAGKPSRKNLQDIDPSSSTWDLAYYDLQAAPGTIPEMFAVKPTAAPPAAMLSESSHIRRAMDAERFYLLLVRVWRYLHTALSIVTLGLILWHLEFAATLLMRSH